MENSSSITEYYLPKRERDLAIFVPGLVRGASTNTRFHAKHSQPNIKPETPTFVALLLRFTVSPSSNSLFHLCIYSIKLFCFDYIFYLEYSIIDQKPLFLDCVRVYDLLSSCSSSTLLFDQRVSVPLLTVITLHQSI